MWIPEGFAHGFLTLSNSAECLYKTTNIRSSKHEQCIAWYDSFLAVDWPLEEQPILSLKDSRGCLLADIA
jgi:dTDP-4-dehydrorhamnose 3,5-epimerase